MFKYRNVVTFLAFIVVLAVLFLIWNGQNIQKESRYQIVTSDGLTLLLDKQDGLTWRNVWCDNEDKIPNCWSKMEFNGSKWEEPEAEWDIFTQKTLNNLELDKELAKTEEEKQKIEEQIKAIKKLQRF